MNKKLNRSSSSFHEPRLLSCFDFICDLSNVFAKHSCFEIVDAFFEKLDSLDTSLDDIESGPDGVLNAEKFVVVHRSPSSLKFEDVPKCVPSLGLRLCRGFRFRSVLALKNETASSVRKFTR